MQNGDTILHFLNDCHSRKEFNAFYELCYRSTIGYLHFLRNKGYQLPLALATDRNPVVDLSLDILGSFLRSAKNKPFYLIFDYFHQIGITDFQNAEPDELYEKFTPLLFRFIRQDLSKLKNETDPQIANLKHRVNDILKSDNYTVVSSNSGRIKRVMLSKNIHCNRAELPIIPYEETLKIVEESYLKSNNRVEWCKNIFETLDKTPKYQNIFIKHELISAIIAVNMKYVEVENIKPVFTHDAESEILLRKAERTIREVLPWFRIDVLEKYIGKGRLTPEYAANFERAIQLYLRDFVFSPPTDLLPVYFREVMPPEEHRRYLKKYKYIFETAIQKAEEEFLRRLKNPTIVRNSSY